MSRASQYVVSCYLSPPGVSSVITPRHDQGVALWRCQDSRVDLVRVWELERVSGQKHHFWPLFDASRAAQFIDGLLATEGLSLDDVEVVWGTPELPKYRPLALPVGSEQFPVHSLAHLYSGLLMDSTLFRSAIIVGMAVDGGPDYALEQGSKESWYAGCVSVGGNVNHIAVESPAALYAAARDLFGAEPGTLMALATACPTSIEFDVAAAMHSLTFFGGRNPPKSTAMPFVDYVEKCARSQLGDKLYYEGFTDEEHVQSAVMKVVQAACELIVIRNIDRLISISGIDASDAYLSLSGGFALNCPTNSLLLERYGFRGLLIPPCANDSGQAVGLGLLGLLGSGRLDNASFALQSAYYGVDAGTADDLLPEFAEFIDSISDFSREQFARDVSATPVLWVDGNGELGPRALGHRSILADPRTPRSKDLLNLYKARQWWRPVAPIVLVEHVGDWFANDWPSPYMLQTSTVRKEMRHRVPAILHLDGSARHQTLAREVNPLLYDAIDAFAAKTGVPILCNTSLNDKGEPIVATAAEAINFAIRKSIRVAYISGRRVTLATTDSTSHNLPSGPHNRTEDAFSGQEVERDAIWAHWRGLGYSETAMFLLSRLPELRDPELATPRVVSDLAQYACDRDSSGSLALSAKEYVSTFGPNAIFSPQGHQYVIDGN